MKMRFFEKTYLLTLILFLVFLDASVIFLCIFTFRSNISAAENVCASESFAIVEAYESDTSDLSFESAYTVQVSYCNFYKERDIYLRFEENGRESISTVPEGLTVPESGNIASDRSDGKYYILITDETDDGAYKITYVKDISSVYSEYRTISVWAISASSAVSVCLAIILYFTLHKIYSPLDKLKKATEQMSNGDLSARADEGGNDEISSLAKDFNGMAERVSEKIEELKSVADQRQRMLDDLAHEMRTPLTVIHGYAEYVESANITKNEQLDALKFIKNEAMRLKSVSEILLDSAFIREGAVTKEKSEIRELICKTAERFRLRAKGKSVEISVKEPLDGYVLCDTALTELVLSNLTENAVNACRDKGRVELGCLSDSEYVTLYVRDNGIGMNKDQLKHIKEPFYRVDKSRSRERGGTGLGLALCDAIARSHGATLDFESLEGKGTLAYIKFKKSYNSITNQ